MMRTLKCIMLIDDNPDDNFYHARVIKKCNAAEVIVVKQSGTSALEYLRSKSSDDKPRPNLIFLDINMPGMNGWEFLVEYEQLDANSKSGMIVVALTTSQNPDDLAKAIGMNVDFMTKPLTPETLDEIVGRHPDL